MNDVIIENANEGIDRVLSQVSYTLGDNVENLTLSTSKAMDGTGNALANTIIGNAGVNVLDGRGGADILTGGAGNDIFQFQRGEANGDTVTDFTGAGVAGGDVLRFMGYGADATISHAAGSDFYTIHAGAAYGGATETIHLTGVTNLGAGDYMLDGALGGAVTTEGGTTPPPGGGTTPPPSDHMGDDDYLVTSTADVVTEQPNGGYDTVHTTLASYTLGAIVEALVYTGKSAFTGTGNALDNLLVGGSGNDRLDGGVGADTMKGGLGNDTYVVDNVNDIVIENANEGTDRVIAQVSYTLGDNIENLTLSTGKSIDGTGNALANTIVGNAGVNVLDGRGGADILTGGAGNDVFQFQRGEANGDTVTDFTGAGTAGGDVLRFVGYGADATISHAAGSDFYTIHAGAAYGGATETIHLTGVTTLDAGDYLFL